MRSSFTNVKKRMLLRMLLSENLVTFWYKARHNVMPWNYTLSLWYPEQSAACQLDNYHLESM